MPVQFLALCAALAVFALLLYRLRRFLSGAPRVAIDSVRPGWVEVAGQVKGLQRDAGALCRAPISGREAVAWRVLIEQETGVRGWEPVVDLRDGVDFELDDGSGRIRVCAASSPLSLDVGERRGKGGPFAPPPAIVEQLIARHRNPHGVLFHKGFRWREWVIEDGRQVRVNGWVKAVPGDRAVGYRRVDDELVLAGADNRPLEVID